MNGLYWEDNCLDALLMTDKQSVEIEAGTGFFNRQVTCRIAESGLEMLRDGDVIRIGYDGFTEIRARRHGSGRPVLCLLTSDGMRIMLNFKVHPAASSKVNTFVKSLLRRVASCAPATRFVLGASQFQWVASWVGGLASGAVLAVAAQSLLVEGQLGPILLPVGIALVNLSVVFPILQSGRPRRYRVEDAPLVFV